MKRTQLATDTMLLTPAAVTAAATAVANLDCKGAAYATIRVGLANIAQATIVSADGITVSLLESDDTHVSNFATITANRTGIKFGREIRYEVDLKGRKRYLRLAVTPGTSGATNDHAVVAAFATLSVKENARTSTAAMVAGTNDAVVIL